MLHSHLKLKIMALGSEQLVLQTNGLILSAVVLHWQVEVVCETEES